MRFFPILPIACLFAWHALPAAAAEHGSDTRNRVVLVENVKLDYAQVLNVEPVYQTLRATRTEEHCEPSGGDDKRTDDVDVGKSSGAISRMVDSVKEIFSSKKHDDAAAAKPAPAAAGERHNCKVVEVRREFRRPIAYDVDYVYKGTKYRSRLPEDPGNRLRIRVSVTPYIPDALVVPPH